MHGFSTFLKERTSGYTFGRVRVAGWWRLDTEPLLWGGRSQMWSRGGGLPNGGSAGWWIAAADATCKRVLPPRLAGWAVPMQSTEGSCCPRSPPPPSPPPGRRRCRVAGGGTLSLPTRAYPLAPFQVPPVDNR